MGRHRRPGPPNQPSRAAPAPGDPGDPLALYEHRRRPPLPGPHLHRPLHGGGSHVRPEAPRLLFSWDGFSYVPVGTAPDLATARAWAWAAEHTTTDGPGPGPGPGPVPGS